jgi:y4mF family transcriptional regulator
MESEKDNPISVYIKQQRKAAHLTQEEFAIRSGLGLRFVRELEQGKLTVRMDKVNQALSMFGCEAGPVKQIASDGKK